MEISALFDDVDRAEIALVNMQALGIFPQRYKIRTLNATAGARYDSTIAGTGTLNAAINAPATAAPMNMNTAGFATAGMVYDNSAFGGGEPPNLEVQLLLTIEDGEGARAQSALISNYARRVRAL